MMEVLLQRDLKTFQIRQGNIDSKAFEFAPSLVGRGQGEGEAMPRPEDYEMYPSDICSISLQNDNSRVIRTTVQE